MGAQDAIVKACSTLKGQAELARRLEVTPAAVHQWCNGTRRVPAEQCPLIERATRNASGGDPSLVVTCEELRPDVEWGVLRDTQPGTLDEAA